MVKKRVYKKKNVEKPKFIKKHDLWVLALVLFLIFLYLIMKLGIQ